MPHTPLKFLLELLSIYWFVTRPEIFGGWLGVRLTRPKRGHFIALLIIVGWESVEASPKIALHFLCFSLFSLGRYLDNAELAVA